MRSHFDKLLKILKAEQGKNFTNQAVIGGLEGFLSFWLTEARRAASTPQERAQVEDVVSTLSGYGGLPPAERARRIQYLFERLGAGTAPISANSLAADATAVETPRASSPVNRAGVGPPRDSVEPRRGAEGRD